MWSRSNAFLRRRSLVVSLVTVAPLLVFLLGLMACVKHPVGDPERSQVDSQYVGVWHTEDAEGIATLALIRPYDARTYLVGAFSYTETDGQITPNQHFNFKAWLTPLGESTFMTLEPLLWSHFAGISRDVPYLVGEIQRVDQKLRLRFLDGQAERVQGADDRSDLETLIREHGDEDALYSDELLVFDPVEDKARIEAILEAFRPWDS